MGDVVPADHAGVEEKFRLNSVLPPGATVAELSNKTSGAASDEIQIAELRGHALLNFVQGAKDGDGMWIKFEGSLPTPAHIGDFALTDWRVAFGLVNQRWWTRAHDVILPHRALEVRSQKIGVVAFGLQVRLGLMALGAERLENLLPKALGIPVDVIPLKRQTPPVANGAAVVVLLEELGLLFPGEIDPLSVAQEAVENLGADGWKTLALVFDSKVKVCKPPLDISGLGR